MADIGRPTKTISIAANRKTFGTSGLGTGFRRDVVEFKDIPRSTYVEQVRRRYKVMRGQARTIIAIAAKQRLNFDEAYEQWSKYGQ